MSPPQTEDEIVLKLISNYPGYDNAAKHLVTLLGNHPPPFIYINDDTTPRITRAFVGSVLESLKSATTLFSQVHYAEVDAVACFTPRLLYDTILNAFAGWQVKWDEGCENWTSDPQRRFNDSLDGFLHGLQAVHEKIHRDSLRVHSNSQQVPSGSGNGKIREIPDEEPRVNLVLAIHHAGRLKETMPDLLVSLTRLAELARLNVTMIFVSDVRWEDIKPPLGAAFEPFYIDVPPPTKQATLKRLATAFTSMPSTSDPEQLSPYHPAFFHLYNHFVSVLFSICSPFTQDPDELAYIAAARWPGFIQPVIDQHSCRQKEDGETEDIIPPTEDERMRLTRLFTPSFSAALDALHPRLTNAANWARANVPPPNLLSAEADFSASRTPKQDVSGSPNLDVLPRMSKFILLAAFLASTNAAKTDLRMFGRGGPGSKQKRKKGGAARRGGKSNIAKVPQRLLGPAPFPLDRLLAILGILLEEYDADGRLPAPEYAIPGEYTEMEIGRVRVYAAIMQLASVRLLHRTSVADKLLDSWPPTFKCGISYEFALALARELEVPLNDLMWEPA